jgi:hypothetical protein
MKISIYIAAILTILYEVFAEVYAHRPISFSSSFYGFEKYKEGWGKIFTLWAIVISLLAFPIMTNKFEFSGFIACSCLFLIGVTSDFHKEQKETIHYISAILCSISVIYIVIKNCPWILIVTILPLILYTVIRRHRMTGNNLQEKLESIRFNWWGEQALILAAFLVTII